MQEFPRQPVRNTFIHMRTADNDVGSVTDAVQYITQVLDQG